MATFHFILLIHCAIVANSKYLDRIVFPNELKSIVGGIESLAPPEDDPVAFVAADDHWARVFGLREGHYPNSYYRFLGLRYAEPPVGPLRFQRPRPMKLFGDHSARKFGAPCPQPHPDDPERATGSEDCLFLNVFTPRLPEGGELLPVLVWIHGGGFRRGSAAQYGGGFIARRDLVLVTANYRLGALGFLSAGDPTLPGNAGMFDLAAVLTWTKNYISFFGGDPNRIIPFGQGTGGSSAALLALSNITQARMAGVISMSGSATSPFAIDGDPKDAVKKLAEKTSCPLTPTFKMVKCLQQVPVEKLISSDSFIEELRAVAFGVSGMASALSPAPVVEAPPDQRSLPPYLDEYPTPALERGHGASVPLLTGVTSHETAAAVTISYKNKIIDNLKNIPNFLDNVLIKELATNAMQQLEARANAITNNILNIVGGNYKSVGPLSLADGLNQVVEVTSDALFNFPAFQLSNAWVKRKLPTFFYNFEHSGRLRGAWKLLRGSPLVANEKNDDDDAISHGSDLPYLFDLRSLEGIPDPELNETSELHPDDLATRNSFLSILEQFAKKGSVQVNGKPLKFPSFISIKPQTQIGASFRECNMALWSGQQVKDTCPKFQIISSKVVQGLTDAYANAQNVFNQLPTLPIVPPGRPPLPFSPPARPSLPFGPPVRPQLPFGPPARPEFKIPGLGAN